MPFLGKAPVQAATDLNIEGGTITGSTISNTDITAGSITSANVTSSSIESSTMILFKETKHTATSGSSCTNDLSTASSFEHTATQNFTANFTNVPTDHTTSWTFEVNNNGTAHTITWQVNGSDAMNWSEGVQPPESTGTDIYSFISVAGTVYGSLAVRNAS